MLLQVISSSVYMYIVIQSVKKHVHCFFQTEVFEINCTLCLILALITLRMLFYHKDNMAPLRTVVYFVEVEFVCLWI